MSWPKIIVATKTSNDKTRRKPRTLCNSAFVSNAIFLCEIIFSCIGIVYHKHMSIDYSSFIFYNTHIAIRTISSVVEHLVDVERVRGSNPLLSTRFWECSSVGESTALIKPGSVVRVHPLPHQLKNPPHWAEGLCFTRVSWA